MIFVDSWLEMGVCAILMGGVFQLLYHALLRVGVRYDTTEIMSGVTEVLCYGTAVVVEKIAGLK